MQRLSMVFCFYITAKYFWKSSVGIEIAIGMHATPRLFIFVSDA